MCSDELSLNLYQLTRQFFVNVWFSQESTSLSNPHHYCCCFVKPSVDSRVNRSCVLGVCMNPKGNDPQTKCILGCFILSGCSDSSWICVLPQAKTKHQKWPAAFAYRRDRDHLFQTWLSSNLQTSSQSHVLTAHPSSSTSLCWRSTFSAVLPQRRRGMRGEEEARGEDEAQDR